MPSVVYVCVVDRIEQLVMVRANPSAHSSRQRQQQKNENAAAHDGPSGLALGVCPTFLSQTQGLVKAQDPLTSSIGVLSQIRWRRQVHQDRVRTYESCCSACTLACVKADGESGTHYDDTHELRHALDHHTQTQLRSLYWPAGQCSHNIRHAPNVQAAACMWQQQPLENVKVFT